MAPPRPPPPAAGPRASGGRGAGGGAAMTTGRSPATPGKRPVRGRAHPAPDHAAGQDEQSPRARDRAGRRETLPEGLRLIRASSPRAGRHCRASTSAVPADAGPPMQSPRARDGAGRDGADRVGAASNFSARGGLRGWLRSCPGRLTQAPRVRWAGSASAVARPAHGAGSPRRGLGQAEKEALLSRAGRRPHRAALRSADRSEPARGGADPRQPRHMKAPSLRVALSARGRRARGDAARARAQPPSASRPA